MCYDKIELDYIVKGVPECRRNYFSLEESRYRFVVRKDSDRFGRSPEYVSEFLECVVDS